MTPILEAEISCYCPPLTASVTITDGGEVIDEVTVTTEQCDSDDDGSTPGPGWFRPRSLPFRSGPICVEGTLYGGSTTTSQATTCQEVEVPPCELTAQSSIEGSVNHDTAVLTIVYNYGYTASEWCSEGDLSFKSVISSSLGQTSETSDLLPTDVQSI